ncbi:MAG: putative lipid II flippase FtsW [Candidatus Omnitrophica bacterium]|nr:putative lipid II flippase FtsW [Candidatus Omnitrophota bacterium]
MRDVRINLFATTIILICIGIIMIFSASRIYAWERYSDPSFFLKRHLAFVGVGLISTLLVMFFDYRKLKKIAKPLMLVSLVLLVLVLIPGLGREVGGARRWFRFKFLSFQPSELANIAIIIYVADFISRKYDSVRSSWQGFLPVLLVLGFTLLLIIMQPDLGTSIAMFSVIFIMLFISGVRPAYLLTIILSAIPFLYILIFSVPYRKRRILAFLNPWADPQGIGFQIIQSQLALGSGGLWGMGLGHSRQKLFYLPAAHTDFIFSIIGEELGLLGTIAVIFLFLLFIRFSLKIIKNTNDKFGYLLGLGLVLMLCFKALVNIGVSCGILPTKGLPLPFISYGGSSFIFDLLSVGILQNIARTGEYP